MKYIARAFTTEVLKLKRTLALWMVVIAPLVVVGLSFALILRRSQPYTETLDPWSAMASNVFMLWALLMLPLFIALESALTGHIEFNGSNWKHLFSLAVPRWAIYTGKVLVNLFLILMATVMLILWLAIFGLLILLLKTDINLALVAPPLRLVVVPFTILGVSWLIIALHSWVSMRWQSVVVGLGIGIAAVVASLLLMSSDLWHVYPWTIPVIVTAMMMETMNPADLATAIANAWTSGLLSIIVGGWDICRRDVL